VELETADSFERTAMMRDHRRPPVLGPAQDYDVEPGRPTQEAVPLKILEGEFGKTTLFGGVNG
jgi:hypothetical protein